MQQRVHYLQKHLKVLDMPEVATLITGYREPLSVYPEIWFKRASGKTVQELRLGRFYGRPEWQLFAFLTDVMILQGAHEHARYARQLARSHD